MTNDQVVAHNPASVWQVPESFKSIYSHAVEVSGLKRLLTYYVTRAEDSPALVEIRRRRWAWEPAPAVTAIVVSGLARPEYLIEIEALAAGDAQ